MIYNTGQCTISKCNLKSNVGSLVFNVTGVSLSANIYTPAPNHDPDGVGNGMTFMVSQ